ncbi:FG-GAP-like repeat-containing protein [Aeoliella sp.]|uniref:FG-GAP repeat domain-containing protein n=1 Tax=Aeoliella sp. TaxID=2795800 RepID=UPI003CCC41DB
MKAQTVLFAAVVVLSTSTKADVIVGTATGLAQVRVIDARSVGSGVATPDDIVFDTLPFGTASTGARVAAGDINSDGIPDIIVGQGPDSSVPFSASDVTILDGQDGIPPSSFTPFDVRYNGGVNVAVGDVNNDGVNDIITGTASGSSQVRVIDADPGGSATDLASFFAFTTSYTGGVTVASGDVTGDGNADIITGAATGLAQVRVINGTMFDQTTPGGVIDNSALVSDFFAFTTSYTGGVNVAAGDVNGDGFDDIIVGASTGTAHVRVIDGTKLDQIHPTSSEISNEALLGSFFAYDFGFTGGVNVAVGDVNGDGLDDIITGAATGLAHVRVINGAALPSLSGVPESTDMLADFFAFDLNYSGGVYVAATDHVPEPSSLALVGLLGVVGVLWTRWKR